MDRDSREQLGEDPRMFQSWVKELGVDENVGLERSTLKLVIV